MILRLRVLVVLLSGVVALCNAAPKGDPGILATTVGPGTTPSKPGCPDGWHLLNDRCYALRGFGNGQELDWRDAHSDCMKEASDLGGYNASLAQIQYDGINSLFTAFLKIVPKDVWIGLWSNMTGELTWIDDGLRYSYENFARGEPSVDLELDVCIKMLNDPGQPGEWISVLCSEANAYICQMSSDLQWGSSRPISQCPNQDYQSYLQSCYNLVETPETYAAAKAACEADGATLASFTDKYELAFGETVMHFNRVSGIWIGLERDDNAQYKWIDGWPLTYTDWYRNEPTENGCTSLGLNGWTDEDCNTELIYFCKTSQEQVPTLPPPGYGYCSSGWLRWNNSCYRIPENIAVMNWEAANYECQSRYDGSTLASVHSHEEGLFLRTEATLAWGAAYSFWIGLELAADGYYDWKDNSLLDYQNWKISAGQPDFVWPGDGRGCAFIPPDSTEWYDDGCLVNKRFVCKSSLTYSEEPGCPSGWYLVDQNCFILKGYSPTTQLNFYDAEAACAEYPGGHLAKIDYAGINSLITSFMKILPGDIWIGLYTNSSGSFKWISDDSKPSYTNWGMEEPNGDPDQPFCTKLLNDPANPGMWHDVYCDEQTNSYICMQPPDPMLPADPPVISRCGRPDYQSYYLACYKFVEEKVTYAEAKQACVDDNAVIASFTDKYELAFGTTVMYANRIKDSVWLGLERDSDSGQMGWVDDWPLTYTDWKANEPDGDGCVALSYDGWVDISCSEKHGYFCKYSQVTRPTVDPSPPGYCPSNWDRYGNNCYKFDEDSKSETFDDANYMCQKMYGATLVSIHNEEEGEFIRSTATERYDVDYPLWIGLRQDENGVYNWYDTTLVDYENWNTGTGEPNLKNGCGYMYSGSTMWGDDDCIIHTKRYVCKAPLFGTTGGCPDGWYKLINRCYALFGRTGDNKRTYSQAQSFCSSYPDGNLASIQLQSQQSLLTAIMKATAGDIWIGLSNFGSSDNTFYWEDGSELTYTNWNGGQPNDGANACGKMHNDPESPGKWIDVYCSDMNAFLCQQPVDLSLPDNPPMLSNCPANWKSFFGSCFWVHADQPLNYAAAKAKCEAYYPGVTFLTSMKDRYEQAFTEALLYIEKAESSWFGLEKSEMSGRYSFSDTWPITYTNWAKEEPSGDINGCAAQVTTDTEAYWSVTACEQEKVYTCKYNILDPVPPQPTIDPYGYCPSGWTNWGGNCYKFDASKRAQTWDAAEYECQKDFGSNLASIHDADENEFIMQNAIDVFGKGSIWTGLERNDYGYFSWVDQSFVVYENWAPNQPDGLERDENCIEMQVNDNGQWNDDDCYDSANYVCKMPNIGAEGGCPQDWYKLDRQCYKLEGINNPKTWSDASKWCIDNAIGDGNLATIYHPGLQSFMTAILKAFPVDVWIGLYTNGSDPRFQWADGRPVGYTAWGYGQPDGIEERSACVKMLNDQDQPGLWNDVACADVEDIEPELNAFLCQSNLDPTLPGNPDIINKCNREGYQSYFESCFRVYTDHMTYAEANAVCQDEGSELASLTDLYQAAFARTVLYNNKLDSMWIGLMANNLLTGEYMWTDGWPLTYTSWGENEPSGEGCVALTSDEVWDDDNCAAQKGFICKYSTVEKPEKPTPPSGYCPSGWDKYENNCYLFDADLSPRSFDSASYECQSRYGAHLASVHRNDEMNFIRTRAEETFFASTIWIGMQRWNERLRWTDQTLISYVNWMDGQPGQGNCVEMDVDNDGSWGTDDCNDNSAFICKLPILGVGGGCPGGWYRLRERCYRLGGHTEGTRMTWQNAQADCKSTDDENSNLASIQVYGIQSLLTAILKGVNGDVWIGLSNLGGEFAWADNTPIVYTNWAPGQPDSGDDDVCVKMGNDPTYYPGGWIDVYCSQENAYLCQTVTDPSLPGNPPIVSQCQRDGYQSYFQSCFRVVTEPMTYEHAEEFCTNDMATLASLEDRYEQSFVEVTTLNNELSEAWIGLKSNMPSGQYEWLDGWPLTFTNWAVNEPSKTSDRNQGCVGLDHMYNGSWVNSECTEMKPFICKYTLGNVPTPTPVEMGYCPDDWESYMGSCYRFRENDGKKPWDDSQYSCQTDYGSHLVYLHSNEEANWVAERAQSAFGNSAWFWIGLRRDFKTDLFGWTNQDLVDYVNWAFVPRMSQSCSQMLSSTTEWRESMCTETTNFVCKMQQLGPVGGCDDGWYKLKNKCYRLGGAHDGTEPLTWNEARDMCSQAPGGNLAKVFNKGLQGLLTAILKGLNGDVWIGLSTVGQVSPRKFVWDDGSALNYTNWTPGQPDGDLENDDCVKILNDPMFPGTWNDIVCGESHAYLCEADLDPSKPANPPIVSRCGLEDYQSYISNCFKLVTDPMTFAEAQTYCANDATELAYFSDKYEEAFAQTILFANSVKAIWLGMSRNQNGGMYRWNSNWPLDWTNWAVNEPSGMDCIAFTEQPDWEAHDCAMRVPFMCKYSFDTIPTTTPPLEGNCPSGWTSWGTNCYYIKESTPAGSWDDAQYACQSNQGSHLASIHSDLENGFLQERASLTWGRASLWLGMDRDDKNKFAWTDNSVVDYVNWNSGEPNGYPTENCIEMSSETGTWGDDDCVDYGRYICKLTQVKGVEPTEPTKGPGPDPTGQPQTGLSTGAIVGIAVGAAVGLLLLLVIVYYCSKEDRKRQETEATYEGENKAYEEEEEDDL